MAQSNNAKASTSNKDVETQTVQLGCKIKMLVGYEDEKLFATITTTKEDIDYQFWYPGRNQGIKEYKNGKNNYIWDDKNEGGLMYKRMKGDSKI